MAASATGCSFVAPGLASEVAGQVPIFSYRQTFHSDDYFGVQATFLSAGRTCYGAAPTFTPYITNSAASFSRNCIWNYQFPYYTALLCTASVTEIPDGPLTINYRGAAANSISPIPFTAHFGPSPAAATVTQGAVVTSNTVTSTTASPLPASTVTVTQSGIPITDYSTVQVTTPTTSTSTVTVSSCSASISSSIMPLSSSSSRPALISSSSQSPSPSSSPSPNPPSSSAASSSSSSLSGPSSSQPSAPSSSSSSSPSSIAAASSSTPSPIQPSSSTPRPSSSSAASSSSPSSSPSTSPATTQSPTPSLSSSPSSSSSSSPLTSLSSSSTSSASPIPSPSTSSSSVAASTAVASSSSTVTPVASAMPTCSEDDGKVFSTSNGDFIIECFSDRNNNDLGQASPQPADFAMCMSACAQTSGCQAVSYLPNGPCYLKNGLGAPNTNNNVWGARRVSKLSSSSSSSSSSITTPGPTSSSASTIAPSASTVSCPGSNGKVIETAAGSFIVECYVDRAGYDMENSPVYPGSYEGCLSVCASRPGCVDVSYNSGGPCYLKNGIGNPSNNGNIIGGKLVSAGQSAASASSPATSSPAVTSSQPVVSPTPAQTITVTTTVSNTVYQCTCEPSNTPVPAIGAAVSCPNSDGQVYTSECGATYAIECSADRYGNDLNAPLPQVNTLNECLKACDNTPGCVDVSYVAGKPGPCYMKSSIGAIRQNSNIWGGRKLSSCTSSTKLKLHRKRVVHAKAAKKPLEKRGVPYGPDYMYIASTTTVTSTSTSFVTTSTTTVIPPKSGATTTTVNTTARVTSTVTQTVPSTTVVNATTTTCPRPTAF